jgi:hypothetical protein
MIVRGNETDGFPIGVRIQHAVEPPRVRLWLVTENVVRRAARLVEGNQYLPPVTDALHNVLVPA